MATHWRVVGAGDPSQAHEVDQDADLVPQWEHATSAVLGALGDPAKAAVTVGGMFGEQSFELLVSRLLCSDTLYHTWDLARATGQDERLDEDAVAKAIEFLAPLDDAIRRPGGFAPKIEPPKGADLQTQLLCFGGRSLA